MLANLFNHRKMPGRTAGVAACLALVALLLLAGQAQAGEMSSGWVFASSIREFFAGLGNRTRVIQIGAIGMALALLIIMKRAW